MEQLGRLPAWFSPHQVAILPIGAEQESHCHQLALGLCAGGLDAHVLSEGPLAGRIRQAEELRYAHIAVVGNREQGGGQVSVRGAGGKSVVMEQARWLAEVIADCHPPSSVVP
jgi:threonyl-tRNA synthetase